VIMTSNLGAEYLLRDDASKDGRIVDKVKSKVLDVVREFFAPEFLNRLDDIVVFERLSNQHLAKIVYIQLQDLQDRLKEKQISLTLSKNAAEFILAEAYNPLYGARPLKRYLEKHIATVLSRKIISEELKENCIVDIDALNGALTFAIRQQQKRRSPSPGYVRGTNQNGPVIEDLDDNKMDVI